MNDRISTEVLANGAIRYAEYDSGGNLVGYKYFKPADDPSQEGTPINKATLLKDATAALFGLPNTAVPDDVFAWIANNRLKIETGTYVGTGTYGSGNANSLTFSFQPKIVFIESKSEIGFVKGRSVAILIQGIMKFGVQRESNNENEVPNDVSWSGNSVSWYNGQYPFGQLNNSGETYCYAAIG